MIRNRVVLSHISKRSSLSQRQIFKENQTLMGKVLSENRITTEVSYIISVIHAWSMTLHKKSISQYILSVSRIDTIYACFSVSLFLDFRGIIFPLAGVPQGQEYANGRESHDPKGHPVQEMEGESPLKLSLSQGSFLSSCTGKAHHNGPILLSQVSNSCWGEVK